MTENITRHPELAIDVDAIARSKTGKNLPRLISWAIRKFIHQDEINEYLTRGYEGVEFCTRCVEYLDLHIETSGLENLKGLEDRKLTFASNHPLGGADGVALISLIAENSGRSIRLMVNDFLMNLKGLAPMCVPVNKLGGQSRKLSEQIRGIFDSDSDILIFPAGLCSREIDGVVQDIPWTKTFIDHSVRTDRWIVPVHFIGKNSKRFYRVEKLRKLLRIKFNITMFFLPSELCRAKHKSFKVVFGAPIPPSRFDSSKTSLQWAQTLREEVYNL